MTFDAYAYLDPEKIEDDLDRMEQIRAEWEPGVLELMHEGYPHHTEVEKESRKKTSGRWWR